MCGGNIGSSDGGGKELQSSWNELIRAYNEGDEAAFIRNARAEIRSMRAQVQSMRAEVQSMHDGNQLVFHAGEMVVCPICGTRNDIKDSIKCAACGRVLL